MSYTPPNSNNANLIFSTAYTPPEANAANLVIGEVTVTESTNQVWLDDYYVYAVTSDGLNIYDVVSETEYISIEYAGGFNTIWGNDNYIFLGTSDSGVKYIDKTSISGGVNDLSDLTYYSNLTSDNVYYIHGYGDKIVCTTVSGVDVIKLDPQSYRSFTTISGANKCFMNSNEEIYYTVLSGSEWFIHKVDDTLHDWSSPAKIYDMFEGLSINDIFVDSGMIYTATSSGVYVINESDDTYSTLTTYSGIKGTSNNFSSIWVSNNKMYVASSDTLTVINLLTNTVYDWYSQIQVGRAGESLNDNTIIDVAL